MKEVLKVFGDIERREISMIAKGYKRKIETEGWTERYIVIDIDILLFLLLRSNPSRQHSKLVYRLGLRRRGKTGKHGEVGMKRNWWVLVQPPYSLQGNGR